MGTFHHDTHPLHGITCVVEGPDGRVAVGRVDAVVDGAVVLLDADALDAGGDAPARAEWLARAARVGVWPRIKRLAVPLADVASLRPLSEYASPPA